jgi:hypothetical protein
MLSLASVIVLMVAFHGAAGAKSLYLASEHHQSLFDAWNINADGTVTKQATYNLQYSTDPAGIALDNDSGTLFITSEFSGGVELVDPVTLAYLGVSSGPSNLAGIDVDDVNDFIYAVRRYSNELYIFKWDPVSQTITLIKQLNLSGCSGAFGLALDEYRGLLWVADTATGTVRAYDVNTWVEDTAKSFQPSHSPVDVAVDRKRNLIYTVSIKFGAWLPPGTGSTLLSKYDVAAGLETVADMGHAGVGVAVDEITGFVYVSGGAYSNEPGNLSVWDTSVYPFSEVQDTGYIGHPAGLAIGNVSYNPLNLAKNDIIQGVGIYIGSTFKYEITFESPDFDLTGAKIIDNLPVELDFVSATENGVYDSDTHTVVWDLGVIAAGQAVPTIYLVVRLNLSAQPGSTIYNYCTLEGDQIPPTTVQDQDPEDPYDEPGVEVLPHIPVAVDIKPQSCPNPLNTESKGVLPVAILGSEDFDVTQIDPATVKLEGVEPLRHALEDVTSPFELILGKQACLEDCHAMGADGHMDLTLKFSRTKIVDALGQIQDGDCVVMQLRGNLKAEFGAAPFIGEDVVHILKK